MSPRQAQRRGGRLAAVSRTFQLSPSADLWHERFVSDGAIALDDPPLRLELADLYAETDIAA